MADKYNGMKRARDWVGQRVELTRDIGNGYCLLPAGYVGKIVSQSSAGLAFEGEPCGCCKVAPRLTRLGYHSVRLAPSQSKGGQASSGTRPCGHPLGTTRWCPDCALENER